MQSLKSVAPLKELVGEKIFILPKSVANDIDTVTGKPCIFVQVNGKPYYIPVEIPTPIPYVAFCVLRELGKISQSFEEGRDVESL